MKKRLERRQEKEMQRDRFGGIRRQAISPNQDFVQCPCCGAKYTDPKQKKCNHWLGSQLGATNIITHKNAIYYFNCKTTRT